MELRGVKGSYEELKGVMGTILHHVFEEL